MSSSIGSRIEDSTKWRYIGKDVKRVEDERFLRGQGLFLDDMKTEGLAFVALLRSPYAHAKIVSINLDTVRRMPGVLAAFTGKEIATELQPLRSRFPLDVSIEEHPIATDKVLFVGQVVACVVCENKYLCEDVLELIDVKYEPLEAVVDPEVAMEKNAPRLFEEADTNVLWHHKLSYGPVEDAFANADRIVSRELRIHRYSSSPVEKSVCQASFDVSKKKLTVWSNNQNTGRTIEEIAYCLNLKRQDIRFIITDVGGGYGNKEKIAYTLLVCFLATRVLRPLRYVEGERESLEFMAQSCNAIYRVRLAMKENGTILGVKILDIDDEGASTLRATLHIFNKQSALNGCYKFKAVELEGISVVTNKCPAESNRAIGKPGYVFALERTIDRAALELQMDRAEIRLKNMIQPDEFPYQTPTGNVYDSGNYPSGLRTALECISYGEFRNKQEELRRAGKLVGIGLACAVQGSVSNIPSLLAKFRARKGVSATVSTFPSERAIAEVNKEGQISIKYGSPCAGQGHETVAAQVAAEILRVPLRQVHVQQSFDSETSPITGSSGLYSDKFCNMDLGAIISAAKGLKEALMRLAVERLGVPYSNLLLGGGFVTSQDDPDSKVPFEELAAMKGGNIIAEGYYEVFRSEKTDDESIACKTHLTFADGVHAAIVEVDLQSGVVKVLKYVAVQDCGTILNPVIVEGQVHGATLHGIAASLLEEYSYDSDGNLLSSSYNDYLAQTALDAPSVQVVLKSVPSPVTVLGAKGIGDVAAVLPPAAVSSAVEDALSPLHIGVDKLPLRPESLYSSIRSKEA